MFALRAARPSARLVARRSTSTSAQDAAPAVAAPAAAAPAPAAGGEAVHFAGQIVSASEFEARRAEILSKAASEVVRAPDPPTFGELMAFSGPAPEIMNGRACMLAFVAAVGAELSSGESVLAQLKMEPTGVAAVMVLLTVGTLAPLLADIEAVPPFAFFNPSNEMKIGRVAMLGLVGLVLVEQVVRGGAALF